MEPAPALCRFCQSELTVSFADLGMSPLSNSYVPAERLRNMEPFYPLHAYVCDDCKLVQLEEFESPEAIFSDYAYFSSYSESWLTHCKAYVEMMLGRFGYGGNSKVIEIASNDGYLLQYFAEHNVPVLGIEPAANVAEVARAKGIPSEVLFFGVQTAKDLVARGHRADLLLGNNVLAHVPDINDFVAGMQIILQPHGEITMEFPHLLRLMQNNQFDTIYHEHFSYLSFLTVENIFAKHGLKLFDVEELSTHGGSLRIFACHEGDERPISIRVSAMRKQERDHGLHDIATYQRFGEQVKATKRKLLEFLLTAKREGKSVVGYGAPAKGNTLLNFCGVRTDLLEFTVDRSPHKQGRFLPGTHIPILPPEAIVNRQPDYVLILPWNIRDEVMQQMSGIHAWGGQFVVPIPEVKICA
ncbi:MAG: methyltransferase domain-containing protein [Planctomycetales bacterium]|nr:methyltransferase domain-containing protein [Planctomycetales bacterium]